MPSARPPRLVLGLVVLAAAAGFFALRALSSDSTPFAAPTPSESPTDPPSADPAPRRIGQPEKFRVRLLSRRGEVLDASNMYGRPQDRRSRNVSLSSRRAAAALQRYLNIQFVGPKTRQTAQGYRQLLSGQARRRLRPRDRRALGLGGPETLGGTTIAANARAVVVYEGSRAYAVTLQYTARMNVVLADDRRQRLTQSGTMVLVPTSKGRWRADMVDVRLTRRALPPHGAAPAPTEPAAAESPTS